MYTYNLLERSIAYLQHLSLAINNTEHKWKFSWLSHSTAFTLLFSDSAINDYMNQLLRKMVCRVCLICFKKEFISRNQRITTIRLLVWFKVNVLSRGILHKSTIKCHKWLPMSNTLSEWLRFSAFFASL